MSEERSYRGATIRRRYRQRQPHGWWLIPDGPLRDHPDKGWVMTLEEARAEIDQHASRGACLMREDRKWLGVLAASRPAADPMFDLTMVRGFSAWCAARHEVRHEPCFTSSCPCACHVDTGG